MEETADTVARVSRPGAMGHQAELLDPHPQGLLSGGLFDSDFKDTPECARRQSGSGQVNMDAWELHGKREEHILPEA